MAHEELKKQYEEDCKNHNHPWSLWEFFYEPGGHWKQCICPSPDWHPDTKYRRKEPPFQPEYFSGLDREKAIQYCGRKVGYSYDGLRWENGVLKLVDEAGTPFSIISTNTRSNFWVNYIKTIPETYTHPTITIGDVELPRPEVEAPKDGTQYWFINSFNEVRFRFWGRHIDSSEKDRRYLAAGNVHLKSDRAQAWANWWKNAIITAVLK
jgi:hypothetical protein